jgi:hypothetical protein
MIVFCRHDCFLKELAALERRFKTIDDGLKSFERLCEKQFHPTNPQRVIAPAKLHRVSQNDIWSVWKIELALPGSGLRPNQFPRMWFAVKGSMLVMLCIATHIDNHKDNEMECLAHERAGEYF